MTIGSYNGNKEHEYCLRCGRRLKNPIARQKGYGAVCEKKLRILGKTKPLINVKIVDADNCP